MKPIRYTMIGSGTLVPDIERGAAGHHLQCGDIHILVDLGFGTLRRMTGLGLPLGALDLVAISHRHQDHFADLLPLLFTLRHMPGERRVEPLALVGYPDFGADLDRLEDIFGDWVTEPGFPLDIWEAADTPVEIERDDAEVNIDAYPVVHSPEAVGFRITLGVAGREVIVAYTGDTEESEEAIALARDADLLISECSIADGLQVPGHMSPRAVGRVAAAAGVKRLAVGHFYPSVLALGWDEIERRIREAYHTGPIELGADGMEIDL
jgi:ribonuclease BN (tRNA processing enzyme)